MLLDNSSMNGIIIPLRAPAIHSATLLPDFSSVKGGWRGCGDWGDLGNEDKQSNEEALEEGFRILSCYQVGNGRRIYIITEADRSSTCILLPEEY
jgi:hypothetical protein